MKVGRILSVTRFIFALFAFLLLWHKSTFFVDNSKLQQSSRRIHLQFVGQIWAPRLSSLTLGLEMYQLTLQWRDQAPGISGLTLTLDMH